MSFTANIFRFLIASPSDTIRYRKIVQQVMEDWSALNAEAMGVVIQPLMWERDATPDSGDRPQALLNRQLVEKTDALVAIFWTRLGSPTGESESGTAEEIEECTRAGKPVLLYFSSQPVEIDSVNAEELRRLRKFKDGIRDRVLFDTFDNEEDLTGKLFVALTRIAREKLSIRQESEVPTTQETPESTGIGAKPVGEIERNREISGFNRSGKPRYTTQYALIIRNEGTAAAEDLRIEVEHNDGEIGEKGELPVIFNAEPVRRFSPVTSLRYPLIVHMGTALQFELKFIWREGDREREAYQTLRI